MPPQVAAVTEPFDVLLIAGGFPPGLNTTQPLTDLRPNETPDGYGYDLTQDGRIVKGTIPSGTARVAKTVTISATTYYWFFNRVWRYSTTDLIYGAPMYEDVYYPQNFGKIPFNEDAQNIVQIVPFGFDNVMVAKSTGSYVLSNASDLAANFRRTDLIQELAVANANRIVELDGTVYVSNANGLIAYRDGNTVELTRLVRDDLTNFSSLKLVADYEKKRIIASDDDSTGFVFEVGTNNIYRYSASNFRFTSRQFHAPNWQPVQVDRLLFIIEHADTDDGYLNYQVKFEDDDWSEDTLVTVPYESERYTMVTEDLEEARLVRRFQVRITDIDSNRYLKEIRLDRTRVNLDDYST